VPVGFSGKLARALGRRGTVRTPDADETQPVVVRGREFLMFESIEDASNRDYSPFGLQSRLRGVLDAIHIPARMRSPRASSSAPRAHTAKPTNEPIARPVGDSSAKPARAARARRKSTRRAAARTPEVKLTATAAARGEAFLMFESARDASNYDYSRLGERDRLRSFLDAIYIPQRLRSSIDLGSAPRTKSGNRTNELVVGWDRAESDETIRRWRNWVVVRRARAYKKAIGFRNAAIMATAFLLLVCLGLGLQRTAKTGGSAKSNRISATIVSESKPVPKISPPEIDRDDLGQVVEVRASDPSSVLLGYCGSNRDGLCEPIELAWSDPPHPRVRFGVYRSFLDLRAIEIRRDPLTRQWVAGTGRGPIQDFLTDVRRMSIKRVPVDASAWPAAQSVTER
jgi:hypothetical protein